MSKLDRDFYIRDPLEAAPALLGKVVVHATGQGVLSGRIVETEAYVAGDEASHCTGGLTPRNCMLFGEPGHAYVYFIYGLHYCLNLVCHLPGIAGGVMIRALEPLQGIDVMRHNRGRDELRGLCSGPGKLTQAMGIDLTHNGEDLLGDRLYVVDDGTDPGAVVSRPRIGIRLATEKPWRFYPEAWRQWVSKR